jgi:hypothetical protein
MVQPEYDDRLSEQLIEDPSRQEIWNPFQDLIRIVPMNRLLTCEELLAGRENMDQLQQRMLQVLNCSTVISLVHCY